MPGQRHPDKRHVDYWLPAELVEQMDREAAWLGVSKTEFVRRAIAHMIALAQQAREAAAELAAQDRQGSDE